MEYQKIINLLDATSDNVPKLLLKMDRSSCSVWQCRKYIQTK